MKTKYITMPAKIYKYDLYGKRQSKLDFLSKTKLSEVNWQELPEENDVWRVEGEGKIEYGKGFSVAELFPVNSTGIVTMGDSFIIDKDKSVISNRVQDFLLNQISEEELKRKYDLGKNYSEWAIGNKKKIQFDEDKIIPLAYRPFDTRYTYFDTNLIWRVRDSVSKHFLKGENLGLVSNRQVKASDAWQHIFVTSKIIESSLVSNKTGEICSIFPLYLYDDFGEKIANLKKEIWESIDNIVGETSPEDILDYVYGYLHSPSYREKYSEFLKTDFPRVPYPKDAKEFEKFVGFGRKLRDLHLMTDPKANDFVTTFPVGGSDEVEWLRFVLEEENTPSNSANLPPLKRGILAQGLDYPQSFENSDHLKGVIGKVWINGVQYFGNVPEVAWDFYIGGYQPAQKYLKDRKGSKLTNEEIEQYQRIIKVLTETASLMSKIDKL